MLPMLTLLQVTPALNVERKITGIVKADERFRVAVRVNNSVAILQAVGLDFRDLSILKHMGAEIESVAGTEIRASLKDISLP